MNTDFPSRSDARAVLFSPFFGTCRSPVLPMVLASWRRNRLFDFVLHTDCADDFRRAGAAQAGNIHLIECTFEDWLAGLTGALGITPGRGIENVKHMTKVVTNSRPMIGEGFSEIVSRYGFWGYIDIDVVLGDAQRFVTEERLCAFDVFTFAPIMRGNLTLLRNDQRINRAWRDIPDVDEKWFRWPAILIDEEPTSFPAVLQNIDGLRLQQLTPATSWNVDFRWRFLRIDSCWSDEMEEVVYDGSRLFSARSGREFLGLVLDALWKYSRDMQFEIPPPPVSFFPLPPRREKRWIEEVQAIESPDVLCRPWRQSPRS